MSLLTELDALYLDHRRCCKLDGGVEGPLSGSPATAGPA